MNHITKPGNDNPQSAPAEAYVASKQSSTPHAMLCSKPLRTVKESTAVLTGIDAACIAVLLHTMRQKASAAECMHNDTQPFKLAQVLVAYCNAATIMVMT